MSCYYHEAIIRIPAFERFPLDMLRYDACYPVDGATVMALCGRVDHPLEVRVAQVTSIRTPFWTTARWESFGVTCTPTGSRKSGR